MIITIEDIRKVRNVAQNIDDKARVDTYIEEVETLFLIPQFGAKLFKEISENRDDFELLMDGGFYDGDKQYLPGLILATSYLVYSRFVVNQAINVTAFGAVFKHGEFSEKIDEANLVRVSRQSEKIGLQYLKQCVEYLTWTKQLPCKTKPISRRKFKIIGD